jgi:hypothetical protein
MRIHAPLIALAVALTAGACTVSTENVGGAVERAGETAAGVKRTNSAKPKTKRLPVALSAVPAKFKPSVLADGDDYTSIKVTVVNNTKDMLSINLLYFGITDSKSIKHDTSDALFASEELIDTVKLAPGEKAVGIVTAKGRFTPRSVSFTKDGFSTTYTAPVTAR